MLILLTHFMIYDSQMWLDQILSIYISIKIFCKILDDDSILSDFT